MEGWLKLHRSISDHWIYSFKEPDKALAWIDLLIMARHTDGTIMLKGRALELKRGQVGMSQLAMQKRWGWSQNKVKRFLTLLKKHSMCDFETNDLTTIVTVCNFDSFQGGERADERPHERADERTTNDQTNDDIRMKECEEGNKVKKSNLPAAASKPLIDFSVFNLSDDDLAEVKRIRVKNKGGAITTQRVANGLAKEINLALSNGLRIDDVLTEWETRGWKSVKAEWLTNSIGGSNGSHQQAPHQRGAIDHDSTTWGDQFIDQSGYDQPGQPDFQRIESDAPGMETGFQLDQGTGRN